MKNLREKYLLQNLTLCAVAYGAALVLTRMVIKGAFFPALPWLAVAFLAVSQFGFVWLLRSAGKDPRRLQVAYMTIKSLKFVVLVVLAVVYCVLFRRNIKPFLVTFSCFYVAWLLFDTIFFFKHHKEIAAGGNDVNQDVENHDTVNQSVVNQNIANRNVAGKTAEGEAGNDADGHDKDLNG